MHQVPSVKGERPFLSFRKSDLPALVLLAAMLLVALALIARNTNLDRAPELPIESTSGDEIILVFVGTSTCGWCNLDELPDAVKTIRVRLQEEAAAIGKTFFFFGVIPDISVESGFRFSDRFGPFHQLMVGGSWLNHGAMHYVWEDHPGPASTPQVLIVRRRLDLSAVPGGIVPRTVEETVLKRFVGAPAILEAAASSRALLPPIA